MNTSPGNSSPAQSPQDDLQLLTTAEVAKLLVVGARVVREMVQTGELEGSWIGRGYRFQRASVEAVIARRRVAGAGGMPPRPGGMRRDSLTKHPSRRGVVPSGRHVVQRAPRKGVLTDLLKGER